MDKQLKDLVKKAGTFARETNGGLSHRIRTKLDEIKPAIAVLAQERLTPSDIREFIQKETGMKIGIQNLRRYLKDSLNYPPNGSGGKDSAAGE